MCIGRIVLLGYRQGALLQAKEAIWNLMRIWTLICLRGRIQEDLQVFLNLLIVNRINQVNKASINNNFSVNRGRRHSPMQSPMHSPIHSPNGMTKSTAAATKNYSNHQKFDSTFGNVRKINDDQNDSIKINTKEQNNTEIMKQENDAEF